jgi:hypothetical protein
VCMSGAEWGLSRYHGQRREVKITEGQAMVKACQPGPGVVAWPCNEHHHD